MRETFEDEAGFGDASPVVGAAVDQPTSKP
jgi:hypothetical protein